MRFNIEDMDETYSVVEFQDMVDGGWINDDDGVVYPIYQDSNGVVFYNSYEAYSCNNIRHIPSDAVGVVWFSK